eukprot:CAMPEP_0185578374 /NCGR_PEP_ID=MMETSP0434-20130131/12754_1 /TAXON_ID=626734 ORGANISM="Favella taraikaensis, Strain Fe Narragansett Bay" /NCGR_SAMPLE_ID=MMETSP0434 /ASSEMBLY_ACC=CAM_ASM_000379 /LENGTH=132 /DNA_ID=CAMNT_0028196155 /DNA_START=98 /DNA_END=496 /DNA_ORIENTATION=+
MSTWCGFIDWASDRTEESACRLLRSAACNSCSSVLEVGEELGVEDGVTVLDVVDFVEGVNGGNGNHSNHDGRPDGGLLAYNCAVVHLEEGDVKSFVSRIFDCLSLGGRCLSHGEAHEEADCDEEAGLKACHY